MYVIGLRVQDSLLWVDFGLLTLTWSWSLTQDWFGVIWQLSPSVAGGLATVSDLTLMNWMSEESVARQRHKTCSPHHSCLFGLLGPCDPRSKKHGSKAVLSTASVALAPDSSQVSFRSNQSQLLCSLPHWFSTCFLTSIALCLRCTIPFFQWRSSLNS